jgi:hypothetical protein
MKNHAGSPERMAQLSLVANPVPILGQPLAGSISGDAKTVTS